MLHKTTIITLILLLFMFLFPAVVDAGDKTPLYIIKIVIYSDSDWTALLLLGNEKIVNAKYRVVEGNGSEITIGWDVKRIGVSNCCYPENVIDGIVEFELLITNINKDGEILMQIQKGDVGSTEIKIYNRDGELVKNIQHTGVVPESNGINPLNFTIPSTKITETEALILGESKYPKMIWAAYYPWYFHESWRDVKMADRPLIGEYSSSDEDVIKIHIRMAKAVGIDGFVVSWWGPNTNTDKNLRKILSIATEEGFYVSAYLESLSGGKPRPLPELESMLAYLISAYGGHSAYFKLDGKPVIFIWAVDSHKPEEWGMIFKKLRDNGLDAFYIATTLNINYLQYFDGLQNYATDNLTELRRIYEKVGPAVKTYHILYGEKERIWVPSISPGYDERLLPDRKGIFYDREDGRYYLSAYEHAKASYPDWIWITSFNEWWENTYIEPSERYGYRYMFLTEYIVSDFTGRPSNPDKLVNVILETFRYTIITKCLNLLLLAITPLIIISIISIAYVIVIKRRRATG